VKGRKNSTFRWSKEWDRSSLARKIQLPVLQGWGADQRRTESSYERGLIEGNVMSLSRSVLREHDVLSCIADAIFP